MVCRAMPLLLMLLACLACGAAETPAQAPSGTGEVQRGKAAWYGGRFHGRKTASGERFDKGKLTAAHRKLPFGTMVRVVNELNGAEVTVRINDRGPYGKGRIIDVSEAAAKKLDMLDRGVVPVTVEVLERP
jgi:rare lipoprotein A